jgi:aspartate oxidase
MAGNAATQAAVTGFCAANSILSEKRTSFEKIPPGDFLNDPDIRKAQTPKIREIITKYVNRERNAGGLREAIAELEKILAVSKADTFAYQLALSGLLLARAAFARDESRGTHNRSDFPEQKEDHRYSVRFTKGMPAEMLER